MATEMRTPGVLNFGETNMAETWSRWFQKVEIYMLAANRVEEPDNVKIAILLNLIGDEGVTLYNTFRHAPDEKYADVVVAFEQHFKPKKNIVYERFKFYRYTQEKGQSFNSFLTELRRLAGTCEFKEEENMIRDKIVLEICEDGIRERLLAEPKLTLGKAVEACNSYEVRKKQAQEMSKNVDKEINEVRNKTADKRKTEKGQLKNTRGQEGEYKCYRCGKNHAPRQCPAYDKKCVRCGRIGHYAVCCRSNNYGNNVRKEWSNNAVEVSGSETMDEFYIDSIKSETNHGSKSEWYQMVQINDNWIRFKLDTGAECNILPAKMYKSLWRIEPKLESTNMGLVTYGEHKLKPSGTVILRSRVKGEIFNIKYVIVDVNSKPILGLNACTRLGLVKRINAVQQYNRFKSKDEVLEQYKMVFQGLGMFPGTPYSMKIKEGAIPKAQPARRVAISILPKLRMALDDLEKDGVIKKVEGPTEWLHPLVIKEKPNKKLRLCLDPKNLNEALLEERYQLPTQDEIFSELKGKTLFSILDLRDSFYQIQLDEESSALCAFATPFDRYKFIKMPFGIKTAAEVFQKKNMEMFGNIPGVKIYIDDVFIAGDEDTHDKSLRKVLEVAKTAGITFNREKFQFRVQEVKLLGHIVSKEGVKIDPDRIESIKNMKNPTDRKKLLRFLGIVKYLTKFVPNLSKVTAPLRVLSTKSTDWLWEKEHDVAFGAVKRLIMESSELNHFDSTLPLTIQTDASKDGLGSVLMQGGRPLAYASRALTKNEIKFAQIEKELLAICFAAEKFHYYIYGRTVNVQTDHKPLVSICKKEMDKIPTRLQRMFLRLFKYDLKLKYLKGSEMLIADALSRDYQPGNGKEDEELQYMVHTLIQEVPMSLARRQKFQRATSDDRVLKRVQNYIMTGWPNQSKGILEELKPFWSIKEELMTAEGLIFYGDRIVVPSTLQDDVLRAIHDGHQGIVKCKLKAKGALFWPKMTKDIENYVAKCEVCQLHRNKNPRQPLMQHAVPGRPWEKIAMDIATHKGDDYLVVVDYYSKWLEAIKIGGKTAKIIIHKLKTLFAVQGYPDVIVSDNVPFASEEFRSFLTGGDIIGITSSPNYARSNGLAERAVGIVKKMISKCEMLGGNLEDYLLDYRSTPIPGVQLAPAQLLLGRQIKSKMPCLNTQYRPVIQDPWTVVARLKGRQTAQKKYYDKGTAVLPEVKKGDGVLFREKNKWKKGEVIDRHVSPRSHMVKEESGKLIRRNREHLILIKNNQSRKNTCLAAQNAMGMNNEGRSYSLRDRTQLKRPSRYVDAEG